MPFISKDWRSPGEEWVKTEEGWEKKKVLECTAPRYAAISNFNNMEEKQHKWGNIYLAEQKRGKHESVLDLGQVDCSVGAGRRYEIGRRIL
ncbi:hypothetical protein RR46_03409 [Papilio xuthus]|uniref:Uncharacterized protein n=1 Tax=Papilio xuthus TaxID=66420 RepID=A0A194Q9Q0_PAPXU|nr:hypothetical protein RR46_03409 [Papilio xuthus]